MPAIHKWFSQSSHHRHFNMLYVRAAFYCNLICKEFVLKTEKGQDITVNMVSIDEVFNNPLNDICKTVNAQLKASNRSCTFILIRWSCYICFMQRLMHSHFFNCYQQIVMLPPLLNLKTKSVISIEGSILLL